MEYAPYVEDGTGLWGPKHAKYEIKPKRPGGWLRWIDPMTGDPVFARRVMHPGWPGNHMFAIGAALTEQEFDAVRAADLGGRVEQEQSTCGRGLSSAKPSTRRCHARGRRAEQYNAYVGTDGDRGSLTSTSPLMLPDEWEVRLWDEEG